MTAATTRASVLVVEDDRGLREGLEQAVATLGVAVEAAAGIVEARARLAAHTFDCVLLDVRLKDGDGIAFLAEIRRSAHHATPVVMVTAYGDSERTICAMRDGAFDYITKPFELPVLLSAVQRAVQQRALTTALAPPADADPRPSDLVGSSTAMLAIWKLIGRAAASASPVLITGQTGVGKERVARAIHAYSSRRAEPFVALNLAALPATLIESELFGHERGAFTGATQRRMGRFELAGRGTLFLDELGELDPGLQSKLLRVLQDGSYERVGGSETLRSEARVMAATHQAVRPSDPGAALREDLYYRLAVIEVEVPPLSARRSDIPLLVAHALLRTSARAVSESAMQRLIAYDWPGNVRELFHVVERAAVLCGGEVIDSGDLPDLPRSPTPQTAGTVEPETNGTLRDAIAALERRMLVDALARTGGNRSEAARQLGVARAQLYAKLQEHGLDGRRGD